MVAVAAGRRPAVCRRRPGCGGGGQQQQHLNPQAQQQRLLAVAVAARIAAAKPASAEATVYGGSGGCCLEFLECLLRALGVSAGTAGTAQFKWAVRPMRRRRRGASAEGQPAELRGAPGRIAGNGACAAASLYTMQGKKGVNQDAMVVWEVYYRCSCSVYYISLPLIP